MCHEPEHQQSQYAEAIELLREQQPYAAIVGFYASSVHGRGPPPVAEDANVKGELWQQIPDPPSVEITSNGLRAFRSALSTDKIQTCAC